MRWIWIKLLGRCREGFDAAHHGGEFPARCNRETCPGYW